MKELIGVIICLKNALVKLSNSLSILGSKKINDEKDYLDKKHNIYDETHEKHLWSISTSQYLFYLMILFILVTYVYIILKFYKSKQITKIDTIRLIIIMLFIVRYLKVTSNRSVMIASFYGKLVNSEKNIKNIN